MIWSKKCNRLELWCISWHRKQDPVRSPHYGRTKHLSLKCNGQWRTANVNRYLLGSLNLECKTFHPLCLRGKKHIFFSQWFAGNERWSVVLPMNALKCLLNRFELFWTKIWGILGWKSEIEWPKNIQTGTTRNSWQKKSPASAHACDFSSIKYFFCLI